MGKEIEYEFMNEVDQNDLATREGRWAKILKEFGNKDQKVLKFTNHNAQERNSCRSAIYSYKNKYGVDWTIHHEKGKYNIYVIKA